jgi:RimJ/RimL family protein N-acetyltransferase
VPPAEAADGPDAADQAPTAPEAFEVRPARPRDAASFLGHYRAVAEERRFIRTERVHRALRHYRRAFADSWTQEHVHLVAVAAGRIIGHLGAIREDQETTRHVATLGMAVSDEWRGRGVGSALLAAALDWARRVGVEKMALTVFPDNDRAIALYRKFGFVEEGRLSGHSKKSIGYRDEVIMGRWLIPPPMAVPHQEPWGPAEPPT